jgi:hypothetical protein
VSSSDLVNMSNLVRPTLARRFVTISQKFHESQNDLLQRHNFDKDHDARVTIFSNCIVAIDSACMALLLQHYDMVDIRWWNKIPENEPGLHIPDEHGRAMLRKGFSQFIAIGFFHSLYSAIESSFRIYLRALDPDACNKGTANYDSIYNSLFRRLKLPQRQDHKKLLDFLLQIRNTIHNNSAYFPKAVKDEPGNDKPFVLEYKGKQYKFEIGKPVKHHGGALNFLLYLMPDILKMIEDVVYSRDIISKDVIIDPVVE